MIAHVSTFTALLGISLAAVPVQAATDLLLGAGARIDGAAAGDSAGYAVAPAGDVNGDNIDDMVVGAAFADVYGRLDSGAAYVVYGGTPGPVDLNALGTRGFRIAGSAAGDKAGFAVAGAEDINGDGFDDVLVGAPDADFNLRNESGSVYVVYGGASQVDLDLATLGTRGVRIDGAAAGDRAGRAVAGVGDSNGDGLFDIALGAPESGNTGAAYVVLGPAAAIPAGVDLFGLGAGGYRIGGATNGDAVGAALAAPGDLNNDGRDDLLIGAPNAGFNARTFSGSTYLVYGLGAPSSVSLATLGGAGYRIDGAASTHGSGTALGTGDINGDDQLDLLIGAPNADNNGRNDSGSVYVVFGPAGPRDLADLGAGGVRVDGVGANDLFGRAVSALDLNGDSIDDLVAGAPSADNNGRDQSGSAYVVNGGPTVGSRDLATVAADRQYDGAAAEDRAGRVLASIGDLNTDAGEDLAISAPSADNNARNDSGSVFVVFGDPLPADQPTPIAAGKATLTVKARKATKKLPRQGRAVLIRKVTVGAGQTFRTTVKVAPKRARAKLTVRKGKRGKVVVLTRKMPRAKVTVRIRATGPGVTASTFTRSWRVRRG